jgi:hypothetical protein
VLHTDGGAFLMQQRLDLEDRRPFGAIHPDAGVR